MSLLSSSSLILFIGRAIEEILRHYRELVKPSMISLVTLLDGLYHHGVAIANRSSTASTSVNVNSDDDYVQYSQRLSRTSQLLEVLLKQFASQFAEAGGITSVVRLAILRNSNPILCGYGSLLAPTPTITNAVAASSAVSAGTASGGAPVAAVGTASTVASIPSLPVSSPSSLASTLDADGDDRDLDDDGDDDRDGTSLSGPLSASISTTSPVGGSTAFVNALVTLSGTHCTSTIISSVVTQLSMKLAAIVDTQRFITFDFLSYHSSTWSNEVKNGGDGNETSGDGKQKETKSKSPPPSSSGSTSGSGDDDSNANKLHDDLCILASIEWCISLIIRMLPRLGMILFHAYSAILPRVYHPSSTILTNQRTVNAFVVI
jgi:hypothetical protein